MRKDKRPDKEIIEAREKAFSIENMQAHRAEGRPVEFIGSEKINGHEFRYYKDSAGEFWYESNAGADIEIKKGQRKRPA